MLFAASSCTTSKQVLIFTSMEDYRINELQNCLRNEFPNINVIIQYLDTSTLVSRLASEGANTACDIVVDLEATNAEYLLSQNPDMLENLSEYDTSKYLDDLLNKIPDHNGKTPYHIFVKSAGTVIFNTKVLNDNNLPEPKSFQDLLNPIYKNLIMMPNPKTSGTGYYFLNGLVSVWGEEQALTYFDGLAENIKEFSTSGSGPVKALDRDEIAIGLGMTFQGVEYSNNNPNIKVAFFDEGSPYSIYTTGVIKGRLSNPDVKAVYDYIYNDFNMIDKAKFVPETIYKPEFQPTCQVANYPTDVKYIDMLGLFDYKHKNNLLDKWKY